MTTKTNTYLITVGALAIGVVAGCLFLESYIAGLTAKTAALRTEIAEKQIQVIKNRNDVQSAKNGANDREKLISFFVPEEGAIDFVSKIEKAAGALSLTYGTNQIDSIEHEALAASGKELLKVDMSVSGSWSGVLKFLNYIETLPYAVEIGRTDVITDGKVWKMSLTFNTVKIKDGK